MVRRSGEPKSRLMSKTLGDTAAFDRNTKHPVQVRVGTRSSVQKKPARQTLTAMPPTARISAREAGAVPVARSAWQLFYVAELRNDKSGINFAFVCSKAWKCLPAFETAHWVDLAAQEKRAQVSRCQDLGIPLRNTSAVQQAMFTASAESTKPGLSGAERSIIDAKTGEIAELQEPAPCSTTTAERTMSTERFGHNYLRWPRGVAPGVTMDPFEACVVSGTVFNGEGVFTQMNVAIKLFNVRKREEIEHEVSMYEHIIMHDPSGLFLQIIENGMKSPVPFLVLPWGGDSLNTVLHSLTLDLMCGVVTQLMLVVRALHAMGVVHGDITPANIVVDVRARKFTLVDFGHAERPRTAEWMPRMTWYYT